MNYLIYITRKKKIKFSRLFESYSDANPIMYKTSEPIQEDYIPLRVVLNNEPIKCKIETPNQSDPINENYDMLATSFIYGLLDYQYYNFENDDFYNFADYMIFIPELDRMGGLKHMMYVENKPPETSGL